MSKKDPLKESIEKMWPRTKKELEKLIQNTEKILSKSENYLKTISDRSSKKTKEISLSLKKEKMYYDLGKVVSVSAPDKWAGNRKIKALLKEIKAIDRQIKKIK